MKITRMGIALIFGALTMSTGIAQAEVKVKLEPFVSGINTPLAMVQPAGDDRIFVAEQFGRIKIIKNCKVRAEPFLDIRSKIVKQHHDFDERGLLGLAFHPDFKMIDLPRTSRKHAEDSASAARDAGVRRVHIGNIHILGYEY